MNVPRSTNNAITSNHSHMRTYPGETLRWRRALSAVIEHLHCWLVSCPYRPVSQRVTVHNSIHMIGVVRAHFLHLSTIRTGERQIVRYYC